jgi:outer membrane protein assembly factor BamD
MNTKIFKIVSLTALLMLTGCASQGGKGEDLSKYTAQQISSFGQRAMDKENYSEAIRFFEALDVLYPFAEGVKQAKLDIVYAYYKKDELDSAIAAADRYIHLYPNDQSTAYAYYLKGTINLVRGKSTIQKWFPKREDQYDPIYLKDAYLAFSDLIKLFPDSKYAAPAKEKMTTIKNLWCEHDLATAEYYFSHEAYVAAANRANQLLKDYPGAAQNKAAIEIMIKSYRALGVTNSENNARALFNQKYPGQNPE